MTNHRNDRYFQLPLWKEKDDKTSETSKLATIKQTAQFCRSLLLWLLPYMLLGPTVFIGSKNTSFTIRVP